MKKDWQKEYETACVNEKMDVTHFDDGHFLFSKRQHRIKRFSFMGRISRCWFILRTGWSPSSDSILLDSGVAKELGEDLVAWANKEKNNGA